MMPPTHRPTGRRIRWVWVCAQGVCLCVCVVVVGGGGGEVVLKEKKCVEMGGVVAL